MRISLLLAITVLVPLFSNVSHSQSEFTYLNENQPARVDAVPGGVALLPLGPDDTPPEIYVDNHRGFVFERDGGWYALIGIPLTYGKTELWVDQRIGASNATMLVDVTEKQYPQSRIQVTNPDTISPSKTQQNRIKKENNSLKQVLSQWTEATQVTGPLEVPTKGRFTSGFGKIRYYNEEKRPRRHTGLDIAAPTGTEVHAAEQGNVVLVDDRFITGKTVVIDHGRSLMTMYCHLSEAEIAVGDSVTRGQKFANVGASGRVTGPHLHWSVQLNGTWVDPLLFINQ